MCLSNFQEFKQISESEPLIGYRTWRNKLINSLILSSEHRDFDWKNPEGPHPVLDSNSGLYSYNYNNNNFYYNYNNNNFYYNYIYNNYNHYHIGGIVLQYGKVAIHDAGYRSEHAKIKTLFSVREIDAKGPRNFLNWIKIFNERIEQIAEKYKTEVITYQDFIESQK